MENFQKKMKGLKGEGASFFNENFENIFDRVGEGMI
jgi:hypothetical protein